MSENPMTLGETIDTLTLLLPNLPDGAYHDAVDYALNVLKVFSIDYDS